MHIKRIYNIYNLKQIITEPTRTTSDTATLIDHIGTNKSEHILDHGVIPCGISDHDVIFAIHSMKVPKRKRSPQTRAVGTAAAMAAALFGLSVFLFTENPLKCFIL